VNVVGGNASYPPSTDILINASSSSDPETADGGGLKFLWICDGVCVTAENKDLMLLIDA
jgi:hypothetical protein